MHLGEGKRAWGRKSPLHIRACGKGEKRPWSVEIYLVMWKSGLFSGKVALLTRRLRPIQGSQSAFSCIV